MSRNPRNYNGLHLPHNSLHVPAGQVPQFGAGSQQEQMKRAIAMEMQAMTREIYVAAVAGFLRRTDLEGDCAMPSDGELCAFARTSQRAARQFFIGLGVIQEESDAQSEQSE